MMEEGRGDHRIINTDGTVVTWGGKSPNMPTVHSSELKKSLTSNIDMFDLSVLSWTIDTLCMDQCGYYW